MTIADVVIVWAVLLLFLAAAAHFDPTPRG